MLKLFNTIVKPILIYGSDLRGYNKNGTSMVDKVTLRFCRCILNVKATTSNIMVYGECGILPPSIYCNVSAMCYINRLHHMPNDSIVKQVYNELAKLHQLGFTTWVNHVSEMVDTYLLDINCPPAESECKRTVGNRFINVWSEQIKNIHSNPILRTYCNIKWNFVMETYLDAIMNYKIESLCRNWEPVRIPWQLSMEDTLVLRRKLKTTSVLFVISSKMIDMFLSNIILIKQNEKTYSQNWHT